MALGGAVVLTSEWVSAQSEPTEIRTVARRMAEDGANFYEEGLYEEARDLFHRANALHPAPTLGLWEARSLDKLGRLVEAEEIYSSVKRYRARPDDSQIVRDAVGEATVELDKLRARIPTITIMLKGANPNDPSIEVQLDAKSLKPALIGFPIPVDPGARTVRLLANGREISQQSVTLNEGDRKPIELEAKIDTGAMSTSRMVAQSRSPAPPAMQAPPTGDRTTASDLSGRRTLRNVGWISAGMGIAGLAAGAVTGLIATSRYNRLEENCRDAVCPPDYDAEVASFRGYRTASTVAYVLGGVALGAGITVLLTAPPSARNKTTPSVSLQIAPAAAGLAGRF